MRTEIMVPQRRGTPRVFIVPEAKQRLDAYLRLCPDEISGLGEVVKQDEGFLITSVVLFPQTVSAGSTDLDQEKLQKFLLELVRDGKEPERYKLWWHSHVNGPCEWSFTDDETCSRFGNSWMLSIVGNKRGEYRSRLDLFDPCRLTIDCAPPEIFYPTSLDLETSVEAEIKAKVKRETFFRGVGFGGLFGRPDPIRFDEPSGNLVFSTSPLDLIRGRRKR